MVSDRTGRVCPVERAGTLDNRVRRWLQNPRRILRPFVGEGMTVLDLGCGPGFFTLDMADLVGEGGRVFAADLQAGMLEKIGDKIRGTDLESRITLHQCAATGIGLSEQVDFALLFYLVHEVPDKEAFFGELATMVRPGGRVLMVEPPFHVSKAAFADTVACAGGAGFADAAGPRVLLSKTAVLIRR